MLLLLISVSMCFPQAPETTRQTAEKPDLNGSWMILCYERDGKPVDEAKNATVTIKDNVISFQAKDGTSKIKSMRCEFIKPGHIRVTEVDSVSTTGTEQAKEGVVVATKDYLAVCLHDENAGRNENAGRGQETSSSQISSSPSFKSKCTVILKRSDSTR
jgi:hypothetical protein